ncbi:MAG: nuclear transport factor 2 family protein [Novosphingobium sp.]
MTDTSAETNKAVVARFFEIFSTGNVHAIIEAMAPDGTWWVSGKLDGMSGSYTTAELAPLLEGANAGYKAHALRITPTGMIAEGDKVAVEAHGFAELLDGRTYDCLYHFLIAIRGGKVGDVKEYMDTQHAKETFFGG